MSNDRNSSRSIGQSDSITGSSSETKPRAESRTDVKSEGVGMNKSEGIWKNEHQTISISPPSTTVQPREGTSRTKSRPSTDSIGIGAGESWHSSTSHGVGVSVSIGDNFGAEASAHGTDWDDVLAKIEKLKELALNGKEREREAQEAAKRQ